MMGHWITSNHHLRTLCYIYNITNYFAAHFQGPLPLINVRQSIISKTIELFVLLYEDIKVRDSHKKPSFLQQSNIIVTPNIDNPVTFGCRLVLVVMVVGDALPRTYLHYPVVLLSEGHPVSLVGIFRRGRFLGPLSCGRLLQLFV